jgi:hypothetical protein
LPLVSDKNYLNWQQKLITSPWFKGFWVFWGIYIVAFYIFSAVLLLFPKYRMWAILAFIAFVLAKFVISGAISFFFKRVRPYQKLSFTPPTFPFLFSQLHKKKQFYAFNPCRQPHGDKRSMLNIFADTRNIGTDFNSHQWNCKGCIGLPLPIGCAGGLVSRISDCFGFALLALAALYAKVEFC